MAALCEHSVQPWRHFLSFSFSFLSLFLLVLPSPTFSCVHTHTHTRRVKCYQSKFRSYRHLNSCGNSECSDEDDLDLPMV